MYFCRLPQFATHYIFAWHLSFFSCSYQHGIYLVYFYPCSPKLVNKAT